MLRNWVVGEVDSNLRRLSQRIYSPPHPGCAKPLIGHGISPDYRLSH
jgi:hypothetical protein